MEYETTYGPLLVRAVGNVAAGTEWIAVGGRASNRQIESCAIEETVDTREGLLGVAEGIQRVLDLGLGDAATRSLVDGQCLGNRSLGNMGFQRPVPVGHSELISSTSVSVSVLRWVSLSQTLSMANEGLLEAGELALPGLVQGI